MNNVYIYLSTNKYVCYSSSMLFNNYALILIIDCFNGAIMSVVYFNIMKIFVKKKSDKSILYLI